MYYINIFIIYSVIGYIYEIIISLLLNNKIESGFLHGPWTPIYGIGVLIMIYIYKEIDKRIINNKYMKNIVFFIITVLALTLIEFIAGHLLHLIFNKNYWNYSFLPLHIGKYIAVEVSILWGLFAFLIVYVIQPKLKKLIKKIPKYISILIITSMIIDLIIIIINKIL